MHALRISLMRGQAFHEAPQSLHTYNASCHVVYNWMRVISAYYASGIPLNFQWCHPWTEDILPWKVPDFGHKMSYEVTIWIQLLSICDGIVVLNCTCNECGGAALHPAAATDRGLVVKHVGLECFGSS